MNGNRRLVLLAVLGALFFGLPSLVTFYTDWLWFAETGYRSVFLRSLLTRWLTGAVGAGLAFAVLWINLRLALRSLTSRQLVMVTSEGQVRIDIDRRRVQRLAMLGAAALALLFGLYASGQWLEWLFFRNAQPFGAVDPILGHDASFYVFRLPLLTALHGYLFSLLVISAAGVAALYGVAGAVSFNPRLRISPRAVRHLSALVAGVFVVLAFGAYLDVPELLFSPAGILHGVANADDAVRIPARRALAVASLLGAGLALYQMTTRSWWPIPTAAGLCVAVSLAGSFGASLMQRLIIAPNEQARETPYIEHNIAATRAAFGLDQVEERELSGDVGLTRADIDANQATLGNVRLWDHGPLLQTFSQIQEIRTYYDFHSVHNDRYVIDGEYRQIMLSARELSSASLPNRNWINEHLTFTHGYGVTMGPVDQVTPEGLPVLFIKDLPPESSINLQIDEPAIYYGELSNDHVFVKTKAKEFHYPRGDDNVYTDYEGDGGVEISSLLRRILFSIRFRSLKLLLSEDITSESRVLYHREITERVGRIAPFLTYEPDPYLLISDSRLLWLHDAYTTTDRYPYATPAVPGINYIRNSIKATVDAYHGRVSFYLVDEEAPIALTLQRIFPELLRPITEMPEDMRTRMRYPQSIFSLQTAMYATYHMTNPAVFYNREDLWQVPVLDAGRMEPYYTIMKLPGESEPEFIQMLPFTPARKDNLASWMVARSDGENYGRMMVFQFPKQKVVFGPRQIVARIAQDQAISPQITLWNQQGSEVLQGTLLVIPIEESLLYIRPLYLRSAGGRIPELKRVVVAYQNEIVMERTLDEALERLFPSDGRAPAPRRAEPVRAESPAAAPRHDTTLSAQAVEHYQRALEAQRAGDWARYGEEIQQLGELLETMAGSPTAP
jgi:uncharacterized membrane protein (UPF0182 family)